MKKIQKAFIFLAVITSVSFAQDGQSGAKSSAMPIDLVADKGTYDQATGLAVYEGNVKVTQGIATIWADKLTIILKNNTAERIEAIGSPVKFEYLGDKQPIKGRGNKAIYEVVNKTITLTGNAVVEQGKDVVKGSELMYNLDKEIIRGSRVKMTFLPKD